MATDITTAVAQIRSAQLGIDMREAIAQGLEVVSEDAKTSTESVKDIAGEAKSTATEAKTTAENALQSAQIATETVEKAAATATEQANIATQKATEIAESAEQIGTNTSDISELKSDIDHKVSKDGKGEVAAKNCQFMDEIKSNNLFNRNDNDFVEGKYLSVENLLVDSSNYSVTGYIAVTSGKVITGFYNSSVGEKTLSFRFVTAFDESKNVLDSLGSSSSTSSYTVPDGVAFVRISATKGALNMGEVMICETDDGVNPQYEAYFEPVYEINKQNLPKDASVKSVNGNKPDENGNVNVIINANEKLTIASRNKLNPSELEIGKILSTDGTLSDNTSYATSGFVSVKNGDMICLSRTLSSGNQELLMSRVCAYDNSHALVEYKTNQSSYTVPDNVSYIRVSSNQISDVVNKPQLEISDVGATPYVPYFDEYQVDNYIHCYLPKDVYIAVGRTIELYNEQVCLNAHKYNIVWATKIGKVFANKISITGADSLIGDYEVKLLICDDNYQIKVAKKTTIHIVSNVIADDISIVGFGDSLSNNKPWLSEVRTLSDNKISFVGTRGNAEHLHHEGRSGWSASDYCKNRTYSFDSIGTDNKNPLWDASISDISWNYYKSNYGINPNIVQIFLGTNGASLVADENANYIKQIIDCIRRDDANIPIIVCNTIYRSNQNGIGGQSNVDGYSTASYGANKYEEDLKIQNLAIKLSEILNGYSNLYFTPLIVEHDSEHNFGSQEVAVNPRSTETMTIPTDSVHPVNGYLQMADGMFSTICGVVN